MHSNSWVLKMRLQQYKALMNEADMLIGVTWGNVQPCAALAAATGSTSGTNS
jgi:hypothetical protein